MFCCHFTKNWATAIWNFIIEKYCAPYVIKYILISYNVLKFHKYIIYKAFCNAILFKNFNSGLRFTVSHTTMRLGANKQLVYPGTICGCVKSLKWSQTKIFLYKQYTYNTFLLFTTFQYFSMLFVHLNIVFMSYLTMDQKMSLFATQLWTFGHGPWTWWGSPMHN